MENSAPIARIAGTSQRRLLASMLGPDLDSNTTSETTTSAAVIDIFTEDRQQVTRDGADFENDAAGVGSVFTKNHDPGFRTLSGDRSNAKDDGSLRRLLVGQQKKLKSSSNPTVNVLGKRGRVEQKSTPAKTAEIDTSSEEEGRAGLGKAKVKQKKQKLPVKVETFESLQHGEGIDEESTEPKEVVQDASEASLEKKVKTKPKSYLDEILEAKKNKTRKKKKKKTKKID